MIYQLKVTMVYGAYMTEDGTVERVFEADGSADLRDLIYSLLNSLDFDFDHMYEFQVRKEEYVGSPMGAEGENPTFDELKLRKRSRLRLIYDFGDYWTFDIVVVERREGFVKRGVELVSSKGTVEQYPVFEDDVDYEDYEDDAGDLTPEQRKLADEIEEFESLLFNNDESGAADKMLEIWPGIKEYVHTIPIPEGQDKVTIEEADPSFEMELWNALMDSDLPFLNLERYEEGIKLWQDILDTFRWEKNDDGQLKGAIGEALAGLGKKKEMREHFAQWEKKNPASLVRMNSHLLALEKIEDWNAAKDRLEKYLEPVDSDSLYDEKDLLYQRAVEIYHALGDEKKADHYSQELERLEEEMEEWMDNGEELFFPSTQVVSSIPTVPISRTEPKIYPNDPCPCGSGKKYKKCCGRK